MRRSLAVCGASFGFRLTKSILCGILIHDKKEYLYNRRTGKKVCIIMQGLKKHKAAIIITALLIIAAIIAAAIIPVAMHRTEVNKQIEIAMKYLNDLDYESAILAFSKILEIDPKNKTIRDILEETYLLYIHAEWDKGNYDHVKEIMNNMCQTLGLAEEPYDITVKKEPTCGVEGWEVWSCTLREDVLERVIPATENHLWDAGTVTKSATYQNDGILTYECSVCQCKITDDLTIGKYQMIDESMTWEEAKVHCEMLGGHLVTITTEEEQKTIEALLEHGTKKQYWIGMKRIDNDMKWVTGESCSYANWDSIEPNANTKRGYMEEYVQIFNEANPVIFDSQRFKWNDAYNDNTFPDEESFFCIENVGFICEFE